MKIKLVLLTTIITGVLSSALFRYREYIAKWVGVITNNPVMLIIVIIALLLNVIWLISKLYLKQWPPIFWDWIDSSHYLNFFKDSFLLLGSTRTEIINDSEKLIKNRKDYLTTSLFCNALLKSFSGDYAEKIITLESELRRGFDYKQDNLLPQFKTLIDFLERGTNRWIVECLDLIVRGLSDDNYSRQFILYQLKHNSNESVIKWLLYFLENRLEFVNYKDINRQLSEMFVSRKSHHKKFRDDIGRILGEAANIESEKDIESQE